MSALDITFIDPLVIAVIVLSAVYATYRGFVSESLSIFAWAAAAFATLFFGPRLAPLARGLFPASPLIGLLAGYVVIFLVVLIPLSFISYRFSQTVKNSQIGTLDRSFGFAFGVVRGLAVVGLAYIAFSYMMPVRSQPDWMTNARLLPVIQGSSEVLLSLVPDQHIGTAQAEPAAASAAADASALRPAASAVSKKKHVHKAYGAAERRELDRLIEATGNGGTGKP